MKKEYLKSFRDERAAAGFYQMLARKESGTFREDLFLKLAKESEKQAEIWRSKLESIGVTPTAAPFPRLRVRLVAFLIRVLPAQSILPVLASMKVRGLSSYTLHHEDQHRSMRRGGNFRAAVFGVNDGLVSNAGLILGIAGATQDSHSVLVSGTAGLIAGAFSMAAGEYISMRSQRELYEHQIALERAELAEFPADEAAELAMIYESRGIPPDEARSLADKLIANPDKALETLSREELGLNPNDLGSPWGAAISSLLAFSVGALLPLVPFIFLAQTILPTLIISASSLFMIGMLISLFTGKSAFYGGLRMLGIGILVGTGTYGLGLLFSA